MILYKLSITYHIAVKSIWLKSKGLAIIKERINDIKTYIYNTFILEITYRSNTFNEVAKWVILWEKLWTKT